MASHTLTCRHGLVCCAFFIGKAVSQEVRSILSPLPLESPFGTSSALERRPKHKGKSKLAKYGGTPKGRKPAVTFQKKLVVVDYMGPKAPRSFGLKETYVLMRGMLPELSIEADEKELRQVIANTMCDSEKALNELSRNDFEFLEANGKRLCVPAHQLDFEWTGRAVKQLSGSGAVYVRLTAARRDIESSDSSSESSLGETEPEVKIVKVEKSGE